MGWRGVSQNAGVLVVLVVNWTLRNNLQWNLNQNTKLFIHENASWNNICKKASISSRGDELTTCWVTCWIYVILGTSASHLECNLLCHMIWIPLCNLPGVSIGIYLWHFSPLASKVRWVLLFSICLIVCLSIHRLLKHLDGLGVAFASIWCNILILASEESFKVQCFSVLSKMCGLVHPVCLAIAFEKNMALVRFKFVTCLTHWGLLTPFGGIDLGQHWLR